ncbi:uncharacterized protein LOC106054232 [Biomphalaria glabrata]|uniref:Uncharacterized protein LOC106054232 n=1 Tax=Biomphalaria glabrata TaxID=6526 RepID=A0A9W2ZYT2_BIOGL|nr:uncharacterized protein LOC106054232 [Biomphalaria glabrata]
MSGDAEDALIKESLIKHDDDSDHSSGSQSWVTEEESTCSSEFDSEPEDGLPENQGAEQMEQNEIIENENFKSYLDLDDAEEVTVPKFQPNGIPGLVLMDREKFLTPGAFFKLFFPPDLIQKICDYTNEHVSAIQAPIPKVAVGWTPMTPDEMYSFLALILYCSNVTLADIELYWLKKEEDPRGVFSHIWASRIMSQERYVQIQSFLKVEITEPEPRQDKSKLRNVKILAEQIRQACMKYWVPNEYIRIEKRVVEDSIFDTKHAVRLWHLQDAVSGYFWNFDFFLGKKKDSEMADWWRETVMKLCSPLYGQGYKLFVDNSLNSIQLFKDLFENGIGACGTISNHQVGFPDCLKNIREFQQRSERGSMRWVRRGNLAFVQWKDTEVTMFIQWKDTQVTSLITTMHKPANEETVCTRQVNVDGQQEKVELRQPVAVKDFLQYFGDKDRSEDVIEKITHLMRKMKFWKTVLYHLIEVARSNSFVMFQLFRSLEENKNVDKLARSRDYKEIDFTIELVQELAQIKV